jgi:hypothetical protein
MGTMEGSFAQAEGLEEFQARSRLPTLSCGQQGTMWVPCLYLGRARYRRDDSSRGGIRKNEAPNRCAHLCLGCVLCRGVCVCVCVCVCAIV